MKNMRYKSWGIEYDEMLTCQIYKKLISGPEKCDCDNCKNFLLARENLYPESLKEILNQLGIDYKKEAELCYFNRVKPGWHLYKGWFHFVGKLQNPPRDNDLRIFELVPDFEDFAWSFFDKRDLVSEEFGNNPVVQLEWIGIVPWVINKEEPE